MDLGATVCVRSKPDCPTCPLSDRCQARELGHIDVYPGRKPKKDKPVREARLFVVHDAHGACLLEQRPPEGIWGGLWTPPERSVRTSAEGILREFGLQSMQVSRTRNAPKFRHTFTHFHLDIEPVYIELADKATEVRERGNVRWYQPGTNEPLGLSAPAVKLLANLQEFALQ
jgi:A/G-specific adenine glycosylase